MNSDIRLCMTTAIDFLATKHGVSTDRIVEELANKNEKIVRQFADLVKLGIDAIKALPA